MVDIYPCLCDYLIDVGVMRECVVEGGELPRALVVRLFSL